MTQYNIGNIKGPKGDPGEVGATGPQGPQGIQGPIGADGPEGLSAYDQAAAAGYTGTEADFTAFLTNEDAKKLGGQLPAYYATKTEVAEISDTINGGVEITPTVNMGMNNVFRFLDYVTSYPKFTIQGKSYVNLLGKDGNCEDVSKWLDSSTTHTLDSTNKAFGTNGIKITLTGTIGGIYKAVSLDASKYYLIGAYLKNGNATSLLIRKDASGGGTNVDSSTVTTTANFVRTGLKLQPSQINIGNNLLILCSGVSTQYAYVDGIQINEITADEYNNLTTDQLLEKYPYVDAYACLQNPYIEVRHDNLVRNGNGEEEIGWWTPDGGSTITDIKLENGKLKVTAVNAGSGGDAIQLIPVKPNTDYYVKVNVTLGSVIGRVVVYDKAVSTAFRVGNGTFNSGNNTVVGIHLQTNASSSYTYFDSIHLIEGTTAPTSYKPCRIERCVIEGKFTSDDTFTYENGEVSGLINWKHKTLFGKDYDWQFYDDATGYKRVYITAPQNIAPAQTAIATKYDGKVLTANGWVADAWQLSIVNMNMYAVSDTDTGWAETINPNADEVKAFMNGWKAVANNGTRYIGFKSAIDGSLPSGAKQTTIASGGSGTVIPVADASKFTSGRSFVTISPTGVLRGFDTGTISGNNITVTVAQSWVAGDIVMQCDNGSTDISLLTWCKNNIAPNYEGYQLHYKLANPEPITDVNTHIHGDIPKFDEGDNYLYLDSGYVLGEVANVYNDGSNPVINALFNSTYATSKLKNKTETILAVNKNNAVDTTWKIKTDVVYSYGNQYADTPVTNYDTNAIYTVDYQILKTMHTTPMSITASYQQDILTAISDLAESVESRQKADSALDNLVDLSAYEEIPAMDLLANYSYESGAVYASAVFWFKARKSVVPSISINLDYIFAPSGGMTVTTKFQFYAMRVTKDYVRLTYKCSDSTLIAGRADGIAFAFKGVTADCRKRV